MESEREARLARRHALEKEGINVHPVTSSRTHLAQEVQDNFDALKSATIAGRIRAIRRIGGLTFVRLEDASGALQAVLREEETAEYTRWRDHLDVGDIVEVTGSPFLTKTGEQSLLAKSVTMLTKSIEPLPEKWHGLQDVETRYRHRELDLIANKEVLERLKARSAFIAATRNFLHERGFIEVETPILQPIPGGASARPFVTHHNALDSDFYLRVAPELYLKRLLVGGLEKIFEIGRCFRNEGIDYAHNPEFTMIELYEAYADGEAFLKLLEEMLRQAAVTAFGTSVFTIDGQECHLEKDFAVVSFRDAIFEATGLKIEDVKTEDEVKKAVKAKKLKINLKDVVGRGACLDEVYKATARPKFVLPTWVTEYPADLKPLAGSVPGKPEESACAQLIIAGAEVINAYYHELTDSLEQRRRLEEQEGLRERGNDEAQWLDKDFIAALEVGMPPASGMGMGIDRVVALLSGAPNLKEVIAFPTLKPEKPEES